MTAEWMLRAVLASALLGLAALAAERAAGWMRLPRRGVWAASIPLSLLLPMLALAAPGALPELRLPAWASSPSSPSPSAATTSGAWTGPAAAGGHVVAETAPSPARPLPRSALAAWLAASLAMLGALAWSARRLAADCRGCVRRRVDGARVRVSERAGPMVVGVLSPEVVLPRWVVEAPEEERRLIVAHEREHVAGGDARLLALGALSVALLPWCVPLWWQHRRLRLAVETDCDARVLASGASRRLYGRVLLRTAERPTFLPALTLAWGERSSHLERRILAMTERRPRHPLLRALPLLAVACAAAAAACGAAADGESGAATASDTRSRTQKDADGRLSGSRELADGTTAVWVGPDPKEMRKRGVTGIAWGWAGDAVPRPRSDRSTWRLPTVQQVTPGSPAEAAGVRVGDVIVSVNGRGGTERRLFADVKPGDEVKLRLRRGGREVALGLVAGPAADPDAWRPPSDAELDRGAAEAKKAVKQ